MNHSPSRDVRIKILAQRRSLSYEEIHDASQKACAQVTSTDFWQDAQDIAFYIAHDSEIDPSLLMELAFLQDKTCYLPALASNDLKHLVLVQHQPNDSLVKNLYGIPEPVQNESVITDPTKLDLVLVPLVAFDKTGSRLGMGLGYYDRTFAFLNTTFRPSHPLLVGFAYHFQEEEQLIRQAWDVGLDWIVTDQAIVDTRQIKRTRT